MYLKASTGRFAGFFASRVERDKLIVSDVSLSLQPPTIVKCSGFNRHEGALPMDQNINLSLLSEIEAARYLGISVRTLQAWRVRGGGPTFCRLGLRAIRYRRSDLDVFVNRNTAESTTALDAREAANG
jgi:excisionase family DNA binding protein